MIFIIKIKLTPTQVLALGFAAIILIGTLLLMLPVATKSGERTDFLTALFTATSATCVTGLVVVDTKTYWSVFGQIVIMLLIQVGGLGIMTMSTLFALILGRKITFKERLVMQEAFNTNSLGGIVKFAKYILMVSFLFESIGAIILTLRFLPQMGLKKAVYYGLFHSISAFNNAGFDLMGNFRSLTGYVSDWVVNLVIMGLIIFGGLGFYVLLDIYEHRHFNKFTLHSKIVITITLFLITIGTLLIFLFEYNNPKTLKPLDFPTKILAALFQAVTPRTAGFNTLSLSDMTIASKFLTIILMFIGASPAGTGGGIKTTTFAVILYTVLSVIKGEEETVLYKRTISRNIVYKAVAISFISVFIIFSVTMVLSITETSNFLTVLYETTSAFGTVGLSLGLTPELSTVGKIIIIFTMYTGRVGPLTLALALAKRQRRPKPIIKYAEEKIMVG
ncbi:TrkH family potassium uptake protein [Thermoanaerobacter sp. X514]|uniref:TrkH family potassium uptake protein n=1 Tax=Thermoanaerobacter sp. (strain X514) TaxID=399726 RepID=UPI0000E1DF3A|nr:TrkH family potassium uptake protein [Thermoanaerobacter sp. X514]ABY91462.1 potassium uptake protein, TrkH family [Thermoanaerobacter sp. X514]